MPEKGDSFVVETPSYIAFHTKSYLVESRHLSLDQLISRLLSCSGFPGEVSAPGKEPHLVGVRHSYYFHKSEEFQ